MIPAMTGNPPLFFPVDPNKYFSGNKSLGGFHLARQNLMELTVLGMMHIVMIRQ